MQPVARSITSKRTWSRRIPRRSGGSFALNSGGNVNVNGDAIRRIFALSPRRSQRNLKALLIFSFASVVAVVRDNRFPFFLRLESFAGHIFRFVGGEENKYVSYVGRVRPFGRIFLRFRCAMHRRVHVS